MFGGVIGVLASRDRTIVEAVAHLFPVILTDSPNTARGKVVSLFPIGLSDGINVQGTNVESFPIGLSDGINVQGINIFNFPVGLSDSINTLQGPGIEVSTVDQYYTSILFPVVVDESMTINSPSTVGGYLLGTLDEEMTVTSPTIISGTMTETIVYQTYDNWPTEEMTVTSPTIISGTLI